MSSQLFARTTNLKRKIQTISDAVLLNILRKKFIEWKLPYNKTPNGFYFVISASTISDAQIEECFQIIQDYNEINTNSHEHKTDELTQRVLEADGVPGVGRISLTDNDMLQRLIYNEKLQKQKELDSK